MRNVWFDLPSALTSGLFLACAAIIARRVAIQEEPLNGSAVVVIALYLLLGAGGIWMSLQLGTLARNKRDRKRALKQRAAHSAAQAGE